MKYPPFSRILRIVASSAQREAGMEVLKELKKRILLSLEKHDAVKMDLLGPVAAPLSKLKTVWRHHLLIKCARAGELNALMKYLQAQIPNSKKFRIAFDMDPQDML